MLNSDNQKSMSDFKQSFKHYNKFNKLIKEDSDTVVLLRQTKDINANEIIQQETKE